MNNAQKPLRTVSHWEPMDTPSLRARILITPLPSHPAESPPTLSDMIRVLTRSAGAAKVVATTPATSDPTTWSGTPSSIMPWYLSVSLHWSYDAIWPAVSNAARTIVAVTPLYKPLTTPSVRPICRGEGVWTKKRAR